MLSTREAFKAGFLLYCADRGYDAERVSVLSKRAAAVAEAAEKRAAEGGGSSGSLLSKLSPLGLIPGAASELGTAAKTLGIAVPIVAGAGMGYLAHRASSPEIDSDDVRKQELINEYRSFAARAREQQRLRSLRM